MINTKKILTNSQAYSNDESYKQGTEKNDSVRVRGPLTESCNMKTGVYCLNRYRGEDTIMQSCVNIDTIAHLKKPKLPPHPSDPVASVNTIAHIRYPHECSETQETQPKKSRTSDCERQYACTECGFRMAKTQTKPVNLLSSRNLINNTLCRNAGKIRNL